LICAAIPFEPANLRYSSCCLPALYLPAQHEQHKLCLHSLPHQSGLDQMSSQASSSAHGSHVFVVCRWLLASVIILGLMHGIAFSAAYQMVARFANKNTISLGLGCVGSGLLALALELILKVGPKPTRVSFIILFEIAAGKHKLSLHACR